MSTSSSPSGSPAFLDRRAIWGLELPVHLRAASQRAADDESIRTIERLHIPHEIVTLYLFGVLSFLEGRFGPACWSGIGRISAAPPFDNFDEVEFWALSSVRNALMHNDGDVKKNRREVTAQELKVIAGWEGASLTGYGPERLVVSVSIEFLEIVRTRFAALWEHHTA